MAKDATVQEPATLRRASQSRVTLATLRNGISEKQWQSQVVQLAKLSGWSTYHPWLSIHSERGWPDLALVRERLILVELKAEKGKLTPDQERWIEMLRRAKVEVYCWKPSQWEEVVDVLGRSGSQCLRMG